MPNEHLERLFSAAYDDALSEPEADQFQRHLNACAQCTTQYERFRASVDAVRQLPQARMPQKVHLPSTAPVAEQRRDWTGWRPSLPRLRFGGATAVALAAAAVIVAVSLLRPGSTSPSGSSTALAPQYRAGGAAASQCHPQATSLSASAPPAGYDYLNSNADSRRPGQNLVLASAARQVTPGSDVIVYAQLTLPAAQAGAPGASRLSSIGSAVVPCLSIGGLNQASFRPAGLPASADQSVVGSAVPPAAAAPRASGGFGLSPLVEFTVPPGTPPGTVLEVMATIPAGYPEPGDPPLAVTLQIVVR